MVFDISYRNDEYTAKINSLLGNPFSFLKALKLSGVGSKRMMIDEVSENLLDYVNKFQDVTYGSLELRPKGVLIHISSHLKHYAWVLPYYQLVIYKTNGISFHGQGKFIRFKNNKTLKENKKFIDKLLQLKIENTAAHFIR